MILKLKLLNFQVNNVDKTILMRILIDGSLFINKGSRSILKPYFVYKIWFGFYFF